MGVQAPHGRKFASPYKSTLVDNLRLLIRQKQACKWTEGPFLNVKYAVGTNNSNVEQLVVVMRERTTTLESEQHN
jgi:hypothetical protein